jgi:cell division protein FtsN
MKTQRGGFAVGFIVGLLVGLACALAVALYVTKVPVPFMEKVPQRTAAQDAAEAERNKNWDPNAPLTGKSQRAVMPPPGAAASVPAVAAVRPPAAAASREVPVARDPAAILNGQASAPRSAKPMPEAFTYFVQAGAFARVEDAEQQRAKLAMLGLTAKITEREQSGRTVYRVRVGPYDDKGEAESAQSRLQGTGVEAALVRVER